MTFLEPTIYADPLRAFTAIQNSKTIENAPISVAWMWVPKEAKAKSTKSADSLFYVYITDVRSSVAIKIARYDICLLNIYALFKWYK